MLIATIYLSTYINSLKNLWARYYNLRTQRLGRFSELPNLSQVASRGGKQRAGVWTQICLPWSWVLLSPLSPLLLHRAIGILDGKELKPSFDLHYLRTKTFVDDSVLLEVLPPHAYSYSWKNVLQDLGSTSKAVGSSMAHLCWPVLLKAMSTTQGWDYFFMMPWGQSTDHGLVGGVHWFDNEPVFISAVQLYISQAHSCLLLGLMPQAYKNPNQIWSPKLSIFVIFIRSNCWEK